MLLNNEAVALRFFDVAGGFRRFVEPAFSFVFFKTHYPDNTGMGRMRIKKKEAVIPFRETMAYRMIIAGGSLLVFMAALYVLVGAVATNMTLAIAAGVVGAAAAFGIFYNLDRLREAKIPKRTLNRMKRR
jgi:uncharacterized membrane protein YbhN (UPF0104 family)